MSSKCPPTLSFRATRDFAKHQLNPFTISSPRLQGIHLLLLLAWLSVSFPPPPTDAHPFNRFLRSICCRARQSRHRCRGGQVKDNPGREHLGEESQCLFMTVFRPLNIKLLLDRVPSYLIRAVSRVTPSAEPHYSGDYSRALMKFVKSHKCVRN